MDHPYSHPEAKGLPPAHASPSAAAATGHHLHPPPLQQHDVAYHPYAWELELHLSPSPFVDALNLTPPAINMIHT